MYDPTPVWATLRCEYFNELKVNNLQWFLPDIVCKSFLVADVFASTASIVHLMGISVDRFFAVVYHMKYRTVQHARIVYFTIAGIWIFSVGLSLPIALGLNRGYDPLGIYHCGIDSPEFMLYGSIFSFYIPCIIMITVKCRIRASIIRAVAYGSCYNTVKMIKNTY